MTVPGCDTSLLLHHWLSRMGFEPAMILTVVVATGVTLLAIARAESSPSTPAPRPCPPTYIYDRKGSTCYALYTDNATSWFDARDRCRREQADLASVTDESTSNFIVRLLASRSPAAKIYVWLGLREVKYGPRLTWDDGRPWVHKAWMSAHYSNDDVNDRDCFTLDASPPRWRANWNDMSCYKTHRAHTLCAKPLDVFPACPSGYVSYPERRKCVRVVEDRQMSWDDARGACRKRVEADLHEEEQQNGGDLVTIPTRSYNSFIKNLLKPYGLASSKNYFIGLRNSDIPEGNRTHVFRWIDGSTADDYADWLDGQPDYVTTSSGTPGLRDPSDTGQCGEVIGRVEAWNDKDCDAENHFICEEDFLEPVFCGQDDWFLDTDATKKKCYRLLHYARTFDNSRAKCKKSGGDLVSFSDDRVKDYVMDNIVNPTKDYFSRFWIGLHDPDHVVNQPIRMKWVDGTPFDYNTTSLAISFSDKKTETCVTLMDWARHDQFRYADRECSFDYPAICQGGVTHSKHLPVLECPLGYTTFVSAQRIACFMAENDAANFKTWSDAVAFCEGVGGGGGGELFEFELGEEEDASELQSFLEKELLVSGDVHRYYWAGRDRCQVYSFAGETTNGLEQRACGNYLPYVCRHWGTLRHVHVDVKQLGKTVGAKYAVLVDEGQNRNVSLVPDVCRTSDLDEFYASHRWPQSSSSSSSSSPAASVLTSVNLTYFLEEDYHAKRLQTVPKCTVQTTLTRPAYLLDPSPQHLLLLHYPMASIFCQCPVAEKVTRDTIQLLRNLTTTTTPTPTQPRTQNASSSSPPATPPYNLCPCRCQTEKIDLNPSPEVLAQIVTKIQEELKVNPEVLSSTRNKKLSATDDRVESLTMGYVGVLLCVLPICFLIAIDLTRLCQIQPEVQDSPRPPRSKSKSNQEQIALNLNLNLNLKSETKSKGERGESTSSVTGQKPKKRNSNSSQRAALIKKSEGERAVRQAW